MDVIARTGSGDKVVGYFDGNGGASVKVSEVMSKDEDNMKVDMKTESRGKKPKNKRSQMLRMIMPMLSRENGDQLAEAIDSNNSGKVKSIMDKISKQLVEKVKLKANK